MRLTCASQYQDVFKSADVVRAQGPLKLRIKLRDENCETANPRLGLVVAKKGIRLAVKRNQMKRTIREHFRKMADSLPPIDIVVQIFRWVEPEKLGAEFDECLQRSVRKLAHKTKSNAISVDVNE